MPDTKKTITSSNTSVSVSSFKPIIRDLHRLLSFIPLRPYLKVGLFPTESKDIAIALGKTLWEGHLTIFVTTEKDLAGYQEAINAARLSNVSIMLKPKAGYNSHISSLDGIIIDIHSASKIPPKLGFRSLTSYLGTKGWLTIVISDASTQQQHGRAEREPILSSLTKTAEAARFTLKQKRDLDPSFAILSFNRPIPDP